MGLFGKKKEDNGLNAVMKIALIWDQETNIWIELPDSINENEKQVVINCRNIVFEYIRQLKEAKVYSQSAVKSFIKKEFPWVNKENVESFIYFGKYL